MTITIGWWAIPLLATIASLIWTLWPRETPVDDDELSNVPIIGILVMACWLAWSLFLR
jgi:hypothetical protein